MALRFFEVTKRVTWKAGPAKWWECFPKHKKIAELDEVNGNKDENASRGARLEFQRRRREVEVEELDDRDKEDVRKQS